MIWYDLEHWCEEEQLNRSVSYARLSAISK